MNANAGTDSSRAEQPITVAGFEEEGWRYLSQIHSGHYDQAIAAFDRALAIDNTSEGALQGKTAALRKKRLFDQTSQLLTRALQIHPHSMGLLSERAWTYYEQGDYAKAIDAFSDILTLSPNDSDKIVWKSSLLRASRMFEEAEKLLTAANNTMPGNRALVTELGWLRFDQQEYDEATTIFCSVLEQHPAYELALQGRVAAARMKGNFHEAGRLLADALKRLPRSAGLLSEDGWWNFEQGQYEAAEEAFRSLVKLQENDVFTRVNLAWSLFRQGTPDNLDEAANECRKALSLDGDLSQAYGCLGVIAAKQGRLREAESNLLRSIRLDALKGRRTDLGALYIQMGRYAEAEKVLTEAVNLNPDDASAYVELGNLYLLTDRPKKAIRQLRMAKGVDPNGADAPRALAIALLETGKSYEAETILREALRVLDQSKRWQLHLTLCQVLAHVGDTTGEASYYQDALKEANASIRMQDTRAEPYFYAGIARYKLGDYAGALKDFRNCISRDSRHLEADLNARRIEALLRSNLQSRVGRKESYGLAGLFGVQLVFLWIVFLRWGRIDTTAMLVLVPLVLTLILVSILLPWLSRLKLRGLEAVLSEPKPKETLASGPKGNVGFDTALATMVGR